MHSMFCFFSSHFFMVGRSKYNLLPWRINGMSWHLTVRYTADLDLPSSLQTSSTLISSPSRGCGCCFSRTVFSSDSILSTRFWMSSGICSNDTTFVSILLLFFSEFILSVERHWREGLRISDFFLQKKLLTTFATDNQCLFSRKYNSLRPVIAPHCAPLQTWRNIFVEDIKA